MQEIKTNFGFKKVLTNDKYKLVKNVFQEVAQVYDLMNDLMSFGVHRLWKNRFVEVVINNKPTTILDVGGGTGDIAFKLKDNNSDLKVIVVDINKDMLLKGLDRSFDKGYANEITWILGDAENLPFKDETFSAYTTAFCFRNLTDINKALEEAYRVLQKGGKFYCLEFSQVDNSLIDRLYKVWSFKVIPKIGEVVAKNRKAYQYLVESIDNFYNSFDYKNLIRKAGFNNVTCKSLSFGIVNIHIGTKL